jgi:RecA-family ATPase
MLADCADRRQAIAAADNLRDAAYSGNGTLAAAKALALDELAATRLPERGNLIRVADFQGQPIPEREWLVQDWLPVGHVTSLYGDGGTGKTLLAQQLMTSAAGDLPWMGLRTVRCPAMGLFCEDGIEELHARQETINQDLGVDFRDLPDLHLWSLLGEDATLMEIDRSGRGHLTPLWHEVRRRALRLGVRLLVVDTAAATFGGNELIRAQVTQFTRVCLGRLALEMNGVVVMCAHPSRAGLASGEGDGASTAWNAGVRARLYFARVEDGEDNADADRRVLTRKKANYASIGDGMELTWRAGVFIRTDQPTAGGIIGAIEKRTREREVDEIFLACLREVQARGQQAGDSTAARDRYAPKLFRTLPAGRACSFGQLKAAMDRLLAAGKIRVEGVRNANRNYVSALVEVAGTDD